MGTKLFLVRHGETAWNAEDRIQGQEDVSLSGVGREQARQLNPRMKALKVDRVYSSDLQRSLETAKIALEGTGLSIETKAELRERGYGEWEGFLWSEVVDKFPEEARRFLNDPVGAAPPGGEPWLQMQERTFREALEIARRHPGERVAVFTHGGPIKAIVLKALGMEPGLWRQISTHNASLSVLELAEVWRLVGFNDTCHLKKLEEKGEPIG
jgi:broad specificity phosphatase PhoE